MKKRMLFGSLLCLFLAVPSTVSPALAASPQKRELSVIRDNRSRPMQLQIADIRAYSPGGQRLSLLKAQSECELQVDFESRTLKTADCFDPDDADSWKDFLKHVAVDYEEQESFEIDGQVQVSFHSKADEPLKLRLTFPKAVYTGQGETLRFHMAIGGLFAFEQDYAEPVQFCMPANNPEQPADPSENPDPNDPEENGDTPPEKPDTFESGNEEPEPEYEPDPEPETAPVSSEKEEKPKPASATPYIIVEKYTYGDQQVTAGKPFTLTIFFKNTSKTLPVENIMLSLETEEGLSITSSSNSFYVEKLNPGQSLSKTVEMKANGSEKSSSPSITLSFRYEYVDDNTRQQQTTSERISIPVIEPDRFEVTVPQPATEIFTGEETALSFPYVNKGKGTLSNVAASVEGDIPVLNKVQNLGNFEAGKSGTIDIILQPDEAKEYNFAVKIAYENASGEQVEKRYPFKMTSSENNMMPPEFSNIPETEMPVEENSSSSLLWIGLAAALGIGVLVFWIVRRHKKKKDPLQNDQAAWMEILNIPAAAPASPNHPAGSSPADKNPDLKEKP